MKQPSPIEHGFNPETKEWGSEKGKEDYRKQVIEILVASDVVTVTLYDTVNSVDTAQIGTRFYKGTSGDIITVA